MKKFQGIGRRFNIKGELDFGNGKALLVDDYGHHPRELEAVFAAAAAAGRTDDWCCIPAASLQPYPLFVDDFVSVLSTSMPSCLPKCMPPAKRRLTVPTPNRWPGDSRTRSYRSGRGKHARELATVLRMFYMTGIALMMGAGDIGRVASEIASKDSREPNRHETYTDAKDFGRVAVLWAAPVPSAKCHWTPVRMCSRHCSRAASMPKAVDGIPALVEALYQKKFDRVFNILHGTKVAAKTEFAGLLRSHANSVYRFRRAWLGIEHG